MFLLFLAERLRERLRTNVPAVEIINAVIEETHLISVLGYCEDLNWPELSAQLRRIE